ncbi:DUF3422 domain-containing protein [Reyranella aquatilis]|uniref:DUF3422 domain-containing protein n=1 Tax=Reyranella aquatilis TaxID=2035356 RepID=A0ABS8KTX2_9HYPH|nr:DUF3422 domain-containing protein [Reyranella aquatilis]
MTRELQKQAVLQTVNRRADIQLRLQSTVEGLSVAAVTYYIVGQVAYGAKSAAAWASRSMPTSPLASASLSLPSSLRAACAAFIGS